MNNFAEKIKSNGSTLKTDILALQHDKHFSLGEDGNFHCENRPYPDFSSKETVLSMVKMMKHVELMKHIELMKHVELMEHVGMMEHAEPEKQPYKAKEIFLIIDDKGSKLELTKRTRPSIVMAAINNTRHKPEHAADEERTENQIERSMDKAINSDPQFLKMMKDPKFLSDMEKSAKSNAR